MKNSNYIMLSDTLPVVVVGGGAVAVSAHIIVQVAAPESSFLSVKNANLIGLVLSTSGDLVLQKLGRREY